MKIVLRDDDTCYYTQVDDLKSAHSLFPDVPISLSIVPFASYTHAGTFPYGKESSIQGFADIASNQSLVRYLADQIKTQRYEILLHGINHAYLETADGTWETEMQRYSAAELQHLISHGKQHLESLFGSNITTFIGPSNDIPASCACALDALGLHTNYIVNRRYNRKLTFHNIKNYIFCNGFRFFTGAHFSNVIIYKHHFEIPSFPFESYAKIRQQYQACQKYNMPMIIYTHYWWLNQAESHKTDLAKFIDQALYDGAEFVLMSDLWQ